MNPFDYLKATAAIQAVAEKEGSSLEEFVVALSTQILLKNIQ